MYFDLGKRTVKICKPILDIGCRLDKRFNDLSPFHLFLHDGLVTKTLDGSTGCNNIHF